MNIVIAIVVVIVLIAIALGVWSYMRKRRTEQLQDQFGPEYDRTVGAYGDRRSAEPILIERRKRVEQLDIRPLSMDERQRFSDAWQAVQAKFVDDPAGAISEADGLVAEVMRARGYPVGAFEEKADLISVDHPTLVENYRTAHEIAQRSESGDASTEDLRNAMLHYRSVFDDLLETPKGGETQPAEEAEVQS